MQSQLSQFEEISSLGNLIEGVLLLSPSPWPPPPLSWLPSGLWKPEWAHIGIIIAVPSYKQTLINTKFRTFSQTAEKSGKVQTFLRTCVSLRRVCTRLVHTRSQDKINTNAQKSRKYVSLLSSKYSQNLYLLVCWSSYYWGDHEQQEYSWRRRHIRRRMTSGGAVESPRD